MPRGAGLGRADAHIGGLTMDDGRRSAARWQRSSQCYAGNCVEVRADDDNGVILLRDSKHPDRGAVALAFSEWSAFMDLVRDARWGESFDLVPTAAALPLVDADTLVDVDMDAGRPVGAGRRTIRVLV